MTLSRFLWILDRMLSVYGSAIWEVVGLLQGEDMIAVGLGWRDG